MNIIFAGTPDFAVPCLAALLTAGYNIIAVYTQPDRPAGRGQKLLASPIKQLAIEHQIPVFQPTTLRDPLEQQRLTKLQADLMVVVAYGLLLPAPALQAPRLGCINVHGSLLPRWRGAAPIQRAILADDKETGITIMQMDVGLDTGAMLHRVACPIEPQDTSATLHAKLATLGSQALLTALNALQQNKLKPEAQANNLACYAKKIEKQEALIDWQWPAAAIDRQIRAFNPWPIAFSYLDQQIVRIWRASVLTSQTQALPGTIINASKQGIDIATGQDTLRLLEIQLPGSRVLPVADVLNAKSNWFTPNTRFHS